jgi:folylpolyglutamate synthase/dihydropteroate synthase
MADKDIEGMAEVLFRRFASVHLVPTASPRGATADELVSRTGSVFEGATTASGVGAALADLLGGNDAAPIIVAGSLYLVGEARELILSGRFEDQ